MTMHDMPKSGNVVRLGPVLDGHECYYVRLTNELVDVCDGETRHVGHGTGDTERDLVTWVCWLRGEWGKEYTEVFRHG